jgi:hypothetical protein
MTSAGLGRGSRLAFFANLLMVGLASFFVVSLLLEVSRPPGLPPMTASQQKARAGLLDELPSPATVIEQLETWNVIVAKNLFNESRKERAAMAAVRATVAPLPKPILHGVVVDGPWSLAYLEDPTSKRVVGYRVGDTVAGGRLVQITREGVGIQRADGQVDVLLKDPSKPAPSPERAGGQVEERPASAPGPAPQPPPSPNLLRRNRQPVAPGVSPPPTAPDQD